MQVSADAGNITFVLGPGRFPGYLSHWTNNTWQLSFSNPDDPNGLVTFSTGASGSVTGMACDELGSFVRG
ncbi:MAG: hypothetical protein Q7U51_14085 [Methanoregula sp.]|nr:hypothetical protein [Methanoregula sp.]